jgi:hypothetical protein
MFTVLQPTFTHSPAAAAAVATSAKPAGREKPPRAYRFSVKNINTLLGQIPPPDMDSAPPPATSVLPPPPASVPPPPPPDSSVAPPSPATPAPLPVSFCLFIYQYLISRMKSTSPAAAPPPTAKSPAAFPKPPPPSTSHKPTLPEVRCLSVRRF